MGVAEDASRRVTEHWLLQLRIGVRVVAERPQVMFTKPAIPAANRGRNDDPFALADALQVRPDLYHLANEFMADYVACPHRWNVAIEQVQVRPASGGEEHLQDHI